MKNIICLPVFGMLLLTLFGCGSAQTYLNEQMDSDGGEMQTVSEPAVFRAVEDVRIFCVHVSGSVLRPGVYELPEGSRLFEAVELAGGFSAEADQEYMNLAEVLEDGKQYHIPSLEEAEALRAGGGGAASEEGSSPFDADGKLDINRAGVEDFMQLNGIGESKARAIVAYREENGPFGAIEEIKNVSGIGEGTFQRLKDLITVK
ncbi:MAG: ComEA family DNA-binding protein [Lachnospiraceae bacterium]|nr:ComEA family DNA-binding protein [Lachnospiraceae bacterium]